MSYVKRAMDALIEGVRDGVRETIAEAPYVREVLGFKPDVETLKYMPIEVGPLPAPALGVTQISPEGRATRMRISPYIAQMGIYLAEKYNKSKEWALHFIRRYAKDVTGHEGYHVLSSPMFKGESITEKVRIAGESVTTRGRYLVKKYLGKHRDAAFVEATNPGSSTYQLAWKLSELADQFYEGPSGRGHKGFLADAHREPLYKPIARLGQQTAKAGFRKLGNYFRGAAASPSLAYAI